MIEIQKKKILLEDSIDRTYESKTWGMLTATTFYVNILLTQSMDTMGIFTDIDYLPPAETASAPNYTILKNKLLALGIPTNAFGFMGPNPQQITITPKGTTEPNTLRPINKTLVQYYNYLGLRISGYTDSKIEDVRSYGANNPYRIGFDVEKSDYYNYETTPVLVNGVSRIKTMGDQVNPRIYVFDAVNDGITLGQANQPYGLRYLEYTGQTRIVFNELVKTSIPITQFDYIGEGWNNTNTSLSMITKEEYLFGIIFPPEVQSDVFIDRGITPVTDKHLKMSEISNLGELQNYGNGYFKLNRQ